RTRALVASLHGCKPFTSNAMRAPSRSAGDASNTPLRAQWSAYRATMESLGFIAQPSGMIGRRRANVNMFCEDGELTQPVFVRRLLDALYRPRAERPGVTIRARMATVNRDARRR